MRYANVIIKNKADSTDGFFTYACDDDTVKTGSVVTVPFGRGNREKEAYVFGFADEAEAEKLSGIKKIAGVDPDISLTGEMIDTCRWMKKRYMCRYYDALQLFLPAGSKSKRGKEAVPYRDDPGERQDIETLTDEQCRALGEIESAEDSGGGMFLLHGVTGSGKTEVYMRAIQHSVDAGRPAIMLVPEISLTTQIVSRFIGRFGRERIAVLHSRLTNRERYDEWMKIRNGEVDIVIGARSAVFAPLCDIGIIVIDEEHESSYKSDMTPKYDTVEVAIKRIKAFGGTLVLGSATPSVATYQRSIDGIYKRLELKKRYNGNELPEVDIVDMRKELRKGNTSVFSEALRDGMRDALSRGKQVILFLNRRGYSTFVSCRNCGYVMKCPDCGISLTYHKDRNMGVCHYCGHEEPIPRICPECGSRYIRYFGIGTERVDEEVARLFPEASTARLDLDTMRKKGSMTKILRDFGSGKTDILTGTQVVAKGLDFRNVVLVGVVSADVTLNIPDYRSPERCFQLITQASGRAGRGEERGKVIIQTYTPDSNAIRYAAENDYRGFFEKEIVLRALLRYPPYGDIMQLTVQGKNEDAVRRSAEEWKNGIDAFGWMTGASLPRPMVTNPEKEGYKQYILIKCPKGMRMRYMAALESLKARETERNRKIKKEYQCTAAVDVNPYSLGRSW